MMVKCNTKGMGPLSILMGSHSYVAKGSRGNGYGHTRKSAVDSYNKRYSRKK